MAEITRLVYAGFSTNAILALRHDHAPLKLYFEIQYALVSKRRTLLSWKVVKRHKFSTPYA